MTDSLVIVSRFCGPPGSGNGGYVCGRIAAYAAGLGPDTAILLGWMTASPPELPRPGDQCLVIAWPDGHDGRKLLAGSALLAPDGTVLAAARAVWLTVPRPVPALAAQVGS